MSGLRSERARGMGALRFNRHSDPWRPCEEHMLACPDMVPGTLTLDGAVYTSSYPTNYVDSVVIAIHMREGVEEISLPVGWTLVHSSYADGTGVVVAYKVSNGTLTGTTGFPATSATAWNVTLSFSGCQPDQIVAASATWTDGSNHSPPSADASKDNSKGYVFCYEEGNAAVTNTTGFTLEYDGTEAEFYSYDTDLDSGLWSPSISMSSSGAGSNMRGVTLIVSPEDIEDPTDHRRCCRTAVCNLCLEFTCGDDTFLGDAEWNVNKYTGALGPSDDRIQFEAKWEVRSGVCKFVVYLDTVEAHVFDCEDIDCRDPDGEFSYTHTKPDESTCTGTFKFFTRPDKRLHRRYDECDHFCHTSDCTCSNLCVQGTVWQDEDKTVAECVLTGVLEWADTSTCSDGTTLRAEPGKRGTFTPKWDGDATCSGFGVLETVPIEIVLDRRTSDKECIITSSSYLTYDGTTYYLSEQVVEPEPNVLSLEWTDIALGGTLVLDFTVVCQLCGECAGVSVDCCSNLLPRTLTAELTADPVNPIPGADDCSCTEGLYTLTFDSSSNVVGAGIASWDSPLLNWSPCTGGSSMSLTYWRISLYCLTSVWNVKFTFYDNTQTVIGSLSQTYNPTSETCDPLMLDFGSQDIFQSGCVPGIVPNNVRTEIYE